MKLIFTEEQFITLLALAGLEHLYLFLPQKNLNDQEMIGALAELYRSGCLKEEKERLVLAAPCREMIEKLGKAKKVVQIDFFVGESGQHLLYPDSRGSAVIIEMRPSYGSAAVRLWETDINSYIYDLSKNERFPPNLTMDREEARFLEEMALNEALDPDGEGDCLMDIRRVEAKTGETENRITIRGSLLFHWIDVEGEEGHYRHLYSEEEMAGLLVKEVKGEEL